MTDDEPPCNRVSQADFANMHTIIFEYLKTPWVLGGRTRGGGLDCWGLVVDFYAEVFGIAVEDQAIYYNIADLRGICSALHSESREMPKEWCPSDTPSHGDLVLMGRTERIHHVGVVIFVGDSVRILHIDRGAGARLTPLNSCASQGWRVLKFYTHAQARTE